MDEVIIFYFQRQILPLFVIGAGLLANLLIIIVLSSKQFKIKSFEPAKLMRVLAANDICAVSTLFFMHGTYFFDNTFLSDNVYFCKIFTFMLVYFPAVSSWLTALISIDRLLIINKKLVRRKLWPIFLVYVFNFCMYLFYLTDFNLIFTYYYINSNLTESVASCTQSAQAFEAINYVFILNSVLVPFLVMVGCSILLIQHIYMLRKVVMIKSIKKLEKDVRFSLIILGLNCLFFLFNTPFLILYIWNLDPYVVINFQYFPFIYDIMIEVYYMQYASNLIIYLAVYMRFRKVVFYLICKSQN